MKVREETEESKEKKGALVRLLTTRLDFKISVTHFSIMDHSYVESFNGMGQDVIAFVSHVRKYFLVNRYTDVEKISIFPSFLTGPALYYFNEFEALNDNFTFDALLAAFVEEFDLKIDYTELFYSRAHLPNEDILEFYYALSELAAKAKIVDESIFINNFLKKTVGFYKHKLATSLFRKKKDLKSLILQLKMIYDKPVKNDFSTTKFTSSPNFINWNDNYRAPTSYSSHHQSPPQLMHGTPMCQSPKFAPRAQAPMPCAPRYPQRSNAHRRQQPVESSAAVSGVSPTEPRSTTPSSSRVPVNESIAGIVCYDEGTRHASSSQNQSSSHQSGPFVQVKLENKKSYSALLDIGAFISCVDYNICMAANLDIQSISNDFLIKAVNNSNVNVIGKTSVFFKLGSRYYRHEFIVVNNINCPIILGQNFLLKHCGNIDFPHQCLMLGKDTCLNICYFENNNPNITSSLDSARRSLDAAVRFQFKEFPINDY